MNEWDKPESEGLAGAERSPLTARREASINMTASR